MARAARLLTASSPMSFRLALELHAVSIPSRCGLTASTAASGPRRLLLWTPVAETPN